MPPLPPREEPDEPSFIGGDEWGTAVIASILPHIEAEDSVTGGYRVPPAAVVGCSRCGKSRSLREIAHLLREERPDLRIVFISFNGSTSYSQTEGDLMDSLVARIGFAISDPEKRGGGKLKQDGMLQFTCDIEDIAGSTAMNAGLC
jgi:hypothetical protein